MKKLRIVPWSLAVLLGARAASADTFAPGSLVVPMDTTYQDSGMLKAYGLVYSLLRQGVPVRWVIHQGKAFQQADFTTTATDVKTQAVIPSHGYRGGPFVIDSADAAKAMPIVMAWQAANATTAVHQTTAAFDGDVARYLVVAPKVAMYADGNQNIAVSYLTAAGIPDSNLNPWPANSPDLLTPVEVAGPTTTNHHDGALFDADGDPVYCQFMSMHWAVTEANAAPEPVAEVRDFLQHPVHFFAECQAVNAFENQVAYGHFLTPNGFVNKGQPATVDYYNADLTFAQIDGVFGTTGGSEPAYALPPGDMYKAGGVTMITAQGQPEGAWDLWMTGYVDGQCMPGAATCGSLGKVSYLGGHQYSTNVPISNNPKTNGVRMFLNSLFDSVCASTTGLPVISLVKTAPATTLDGNVTFTIDYSSAGPSVALGAVLTDPIPAGSTFVSATGGGVFAGGIVTWNLGNLGATEAGTVALTVQLPALGTYTNTATLGYKVGLNPFTKTSNTTSTLYAMDVDGGAGSGGAGGASASSSTSGAGGAGGSSSSSSGAGGASTTSTSGVGGASASSSSGAGGASGSSSSSGASASSTSGAGGASTTSSGAGGAGSSGGPGDTGSCNCRAAGAPAPEQRAWLLLGAALAFRLRRRRTAR